MSKSKLVVISGPSGVGKGTIIDLLLKDKERFAKVVSDTTRPPRPHEVEGEDHYFVSEKQFRDLEQAEAIIEHHKFDHHMYGVEKAKIDQLLTTNKFAILEVDIHGGLAVKKFYPKAKLIFILPPNDKELERRLEGRHTEKAKDVELR